MVLAIKLRDPKNTWEGGGEMADKGTKDMQSRQGSVATDLQEIYTP